MKDLNTNKIVALSYIESNHFLLFQVDDESNHFLTLNLDEGKILKENNFTFENERKI